MYPFPHGASGGVGIATVQFARIRGLTVVGTAGTDEGMECVKKAGAHFVFDHRQADYIEQVEGHEWNRTGANL